MHLAKQSHRILAERGVSSLFLDILQANEEPPVFLEGIFHAPSEYFLEEEANEYTQGYLIPIFDDGGPAVATFFDPVKSHFVEIFMESGSEGWTFSNWQQVLCVMMNQMIENGDSIPDKSLVEQVGFLHFEELLSFRKNHAKKYDEWDVVFGRFVGEL